VFVTETSPVEQIYVVEEKTDPYFEITVPFRIINGGSQTGM
jgi:hypothetical protein